MQDRAFPYVRPAELSAELEKIKSEGVAISHGDCLEEAQLLADKICEVCKPKELIICPHEPFTGAHVGPGMLALFFFGNER